MGPRTISTLRTTFVLRQLMWAVAGVIAMVIATRWTIPVPAAGGRLLAGFDHNLDAGCGLLPRPLANTHRWIKFGHSLFQPSELAKLRSSCPLHGSAPPLEGDRRLEHTLLPRLRE